MASSEEQNALREDFTFWLGMLARQWRSELDRRLSPYILTEARWIILYRLSVSQKVLTQKQLAKVAGVQGPTLVRTLDWLESKGLIERQEVPDDRRLKTVHLTPKAEPALRQIEAVVKGVRAQIFRDIPDEELEACLSVFKRIGEKFDIFAMQEEERDRELVLGGEPHKKVG